MMSISDLGDFRCRSRMWNNKFPFPSSLEAQEDPAVKMVLNQEDANLAPIPSNQGISRITPSCYLEFKIVGTRKRYPDVYFPNRIGLRCRWWLV